MKRCCVVLGMLATLLIGPQAPSGVEARSLSSQIQGVFGATGILLTPDPVRNPDVGVDIPHDLHFDAESLDLFALTVEQMSANAADFPAISTAPGFTYRYDPNTQAFERSSNTLGPVYVEAHTKALQIHRAINNKG